MAEDNADYGARLLNARFESLDSRLDELEAKAAPRSNMMLSVASALALVISIATGGFTIYERIAMEPERERQEQYAEFERLFNELNSANAQIQMQIGQATTPEQKMMVNLTQSARVGSLLDSVERIEPSVRPRLTAQHNAVLAQFNFQMYDFEGARQFSDRVMQKNPSESQKGRVYKLLGMLEAQIDGPAGDQRAADYFNQAIAAFSAAKGDPSSPALVADTRLDLIALAMIETGDCAALPSLAEAYLVAATNPMVQQMRIGLDMRLTELAATPIRKCQLPSGIISTTPPGLSSRKPCQRRLSRRRSHRSLQSTEMRAIVIA